MKLRLFILFTLLLSTKIFAQTTPLSLQITQLTTNYYVYTTYHLYKGEPASANGLYVVTNKGVVLIDTPWDTTQFQPLLDSIRNKHHQQVVLCIATHSHEDRTAGLQFYKQKNIKTYTSTLTDSISKANNHPRAQFHFTKDTTFTIGQVSFQTCYAGAGHTKDNIIIWFPQERVLHGGCLIKSTDATNLGYIKEANLQAWPQTLKSIQQKFPQPKFIIPGHDGFTNLNAINYTLKLLQQNNTTSLPQSKTFTLLDTNVAVGQTYTTNRIYFTVNKTGILEQSEVIVDSMVTFLNANKNVKIEIQVYCDSRGSPVLNSKLTMARASSIVDYLVYKGINKDRLIPKGYGELKLLIPDSQISKAKTNQEKEALHALNRRVVLKIVSNN